MGKSEHVSFIGKLNSHLIKKQFKEKRKSINEGKQNDNSEKEEKKEKEKKHFWWKWLSFFRGHSARRGGVQRDLKSKTNLKPRRKTSQVSKTSGTKLAPESSSRDVINSAEGDGKFERERSSFYEEGVKSTVEFVKSPEKLYTCAPSLCQEPDNLIEIAVTLGHRAPSESGASKRSKDIKRIKINEKRKRSRDAEESSESCLKTFKTVSEPSWNEKFKILHQQELKEETEDLVQQFMILESEVDIDCSECSSKATNSKEKCLLSKSSGSNSKEALREVSPEVLVNIRPFKMFISERYFTPEEVSSCTDQMQDQLEEENESQMKMKRPSQKVETSTVALESRVSPRLPFKRFSVINELDKADGSAFSLTNGSLIPRLWEVQTGSTCCRDSGEEISGDSDGTVARDYSRMPTLSVLGFFDGEIQEEDSKEESDGKWDTEDTEEVPPAKGTVDEVLDSLDDSNHDIIFQKNISQFRKKIETPQMDFIKPAIRLKKRKEKDGRKENTSDEALRNAYDWKDPRPQAQAFGDFRFERLEVQRNEGKSDKTFGTSFLLSFEDKAVAVMLGVRMEWGMVHVPQTVEVLYTLGNETAVVGGVDGIGDSPNRVLYSMKAYEAIAALYTLGFWGGACGTPARNFPETFRLLHDKAECFYLLPEHLFVEMTQTSGSDIIQSDVNKMAGRNFLESLGSIAKSEGDGEMELKFPPRKKNITFTQSWAPQRVIVQMLFCSTNDYAAVICDRMSLPGVPARIRSEPNVPNKDEMREKEPVSETRMSSSSKKTVVETGPEPTAEKSVDSDLRFDGFQVIYSNSRESLNDEEDDVAKAVLSGSKHDFFFFPLKRSSGDESPKPCPACAQTPLPDTGSGGLRFKSNSSPGEHMNHIEFALPDHRARRSFNLSKEMEKDVEGFRKKRSTLGAEEPYRSLLLPRELKSLLETECKGLEGNKAEVSEKSGTNLRKEVTAAFNTIKEFNSFKGEHRGGNGRMSLVIMVSKK